MNEQLKDEVKFLKDRLKEAQKQIEENEYYADVAEKGARQIKMFVDALIAQGFTEEFAKELLLEAIKGGVK